MAFLSTTGNFLLILIGFGFLIFVHELGHFLAARWANIRVDTFAIGMGPVVLAFRKGIGLRFGSTDRELVERLGRPAAEISEAHLAELGISETEYTLRALPLGGYVRMLGQEDANPGAVSDSPRGYQRCPIGKRMVVVSAGVLMNLVTAVILFWIAFAFGVRFIAPVADRPAGGWPAATAVATNLALLTPEERAAVGASGIHEGDRILDVDGETARTITDLQLAAAMAKEGAAVRVLVERRGVATPLAFEMIPQRDPTDGLYKLGLDAARSGTITSITTSDEVVRRVLASSGAQGLAPGAALVSVDGRPAATFDELFWHIADADGSPVATEWTVPGAAQPIRVDVQPEPALGRLIVPSGSDDIAVPGLFGLTPLVKVAMAQPDGANAATLEPGDVLLRLGAVDAPSFLELRQATKEAAGREIPARVLRGGKEIDLVLKVSPQGRLDIAPDFALALPRVAGPVLAVRPPAGKDDGAAGDAPAATQAQSAVGTVPTPVAGLRIAPGSSIVAVNGRPVDDWGSFRQSARAATADARASDSGATLTLSLLPPEPGAAAVEHRVEISADEVRTLHALRWELPIPQTIFDPNFTTLKASGPLDAIAMGLHETKKMVQQVYLTIDRLVRGRIGIDKLNGPVGIFHIGVKVADEGFTYLLFFIAMLSVNLAVMNFLPLPIVDGGLFLFLVYEKLVGRPPSIGFQNAATAAGLLLIGSIFLITFFNDVARLIG